MNENQIAFIICADNVQYYNECVRYINELEVPEQFTTDIICIQEADNMIQGYRAGMQASDAKYKVYLRQDVFILNRSFLHDTLQIFQQDENIGLIGMVGCSKLPEDANCISCWDIGSMEIFNGRTLEDDFKFRKPNQKYEAVMAVQGTIMATQYDIGWQEELEKVLDGWYFYDIALSLNMFNNGYKVVVPEQKTPWCYHIKQWEDLKEYTRLRFKMIERYPEFFKSRENEQDIMQKVKQVVQVANIRNDMIRLLERGLYEPMVELAEGIRSSWPEDMQIREIANMVEIYTLEERSSICTSHSDWFGFHNWQKMYEYYEWIRLVLLRLAYNREDERIDELKRKLADGNISFDAVSMIARISLRNTEQIDRYLLKREMNEPLVSAIVLVHNGEDTIGQTIESILNQTYYNIELIIVDDASTDRSRDIICGYKDERIKVIYLEKNQNVCFAGNIGFQKAKGKYVALIGHDDLWNKDKIYKQVAFLEEHEDYGACFTWIDIIDENGQQKNAMFPDLYYKLCADNFGQAKWLEKMLIKSNHMCAPSAFIRRETLEMTGYYRYGLVQLQDYDLWLRFLSEGPIYFIQEKLTFYRRFCENASKQNLSSGSFGNQNRDWHETHWVQYDYLYKMDDQKFLKLFQKSLRNPGANGGKEVLCEKVFLLWKLKNCFAVKLFIELLEDEESRTILSGKYQFELNDFYRINKEPVFFDPGYKISSNN